MTAPAPLSAWIRGRSPAPPPHLLSRIEAMAATAPRAAATADTLLDVAAAAMADVLRDGCLTRSAALDLLAVDALVTYAVEAAADDPQHLDERSGGTMARIAALAEPYDG
ncbi:MAG TPA: hypothetical protein VL308_03605 [Gemmatimonadaceae bacterium]|nr:hypothetical protein [Gemmatimonadaceae bacterium]